jgi:hypothetical protein
MIKKWSEVLQRRMIWRGCTNMESAEVGKIMG